MHGLEHEGVFCSLAIEHTTVWRLWGQWVFMDVLMYYIRVIHIN